MGVPSELDVLPCKPDPSSESRASVAAEREERGWHQVQISGNLAEVPDPESADGEDSLEEPPLFAGIEDSVSIAGDSGECQPGGQVTIGGVDQPVAKAIGLATKASDDNRLILLATVGSRQVNVLIDSGATHSMVQKSWITNHGIKYDQSETRSLQGFGVENHIRVIGTVTLQVVLKGVTLKPLLVQVVDVTADTDVPVILGEDFLRDNALSIDLSRKRLSLSLPDGGSIDMYCHSDEAHRPAIFVNVACIVAETCQVSSAEFVRVPLMLSIPVDTQAMVSADSAEGLPPLLFEPLGELKRMHVLPGVVESDSFEVLAMSNSDIKRQVPKGTVVGKVSTIITRSDVEPSGEVMVSSAGSPAQGKEPEKHGVLELISLTDHLSALEKERVLTMLNGHTKVFSKDNADVGFLDVCEHQIELLDSTPIYLKPSRFPEPVAGDIVARCEELQLLDIIEPSASAWSSPVVPVRKKDGTMRLCVDYRRLNAVTKPDRYPLPNLNDSVYSLYGKQYFTSLDVTRGFYHIPIEPGSREVTAFSTPSGHWQFKRMPFGLRNAPSAFQRAMQVVLNKFPRGNVIVYIDDVLVMSGTFEEHLVLVSKVLATLEQHGVKVKTEKCKWFEREVEYLGHLVGVDGMRKVPGYVDKVKNMARPTTVGQLREFLGLANFQRKFVPHFSTIQKPLSE